MEQLEKGQNGFKFWESLMRHVFFFLIYISNTFVGEVIAEISPGTHVFPFLYRVPKNYESKTSDDESQETTNADALEGRGKV